MDEVGGLGTSLHVGAVTGRYVLSDKPQRLGVNVFACRLRSISADGLIVAAPVVGAPGDAVTVMLGPFGTLHGKVVRHTQDGFVVALTGTAAERADLAERIDMFRNRLWTGTADRRKQMRFMPGEPRSIIIDAAGAVRPCLVVDYSASGAAVSADTTPSLGAPITVGQVAGHVVRHFDVGFAVHFDQVQSGEEIEDLLEAPEEWRDAVAVLHPTRIDTSEGEDLALAGSAY